jgi:hypothetical protein
MRSFALAASSVVLFTVSRGFSLPDPHTGIPHRSRSHTAESRVVRATPPVSPRALVIASLGAAGDNELRQTQSLRVAEVAREPVVGSAERVEKRRRVAYLRSTGTASETTATEATPQIFADGVISTGHEFTVAFMPDASEVYFTRTYPETHSAHILRSVWRAGAWQPPQPVTFSGESWSDLDPALSPDGQRLFFVSTRSRPNGTAGPAKDMDIWYADRMGSGWGPPQWIREISSDSKEGSPTVDRVGTLCFFSDRGPAPNANAIYCAAKTDRGYAPPVRLGAQINSGPSDTSPFLSADGQTILFYSTRPGGFGQADIYLSTQRNGDWTTPVNLGPTINTEAFEYNPSVSPDGHTLYFGRSGKVWQIPVDSIDSQLIRSEMFH